MLVDIGCNLGSGRLYPRHDEIIARAESAGVGRQILTGSDPESNRRCLELAQRYSGLFATVGHHPHHASTWQPPSHRLALQAAGRVEKVVAIGEMGLDYKRNFSPRDAQLRCFSDQLELAAALQKPVFLHQRDAEADFLALMRERRAALVGGVWHCFSASKKALEAALDLDLYLGITGWICDPERGALLRALVREMPQNRLLIETDAPYLAPKTLSPVPKINEPCYLPAVLATLAQCRGDDPETLAAATTANALRLFALPPL